MNKDMKFEEALSLLEDRVRLLESGNMSLDESLSAYEEAIGLVRICNEKLDSAEAKVRILTESADGSVTDAPFPAINEN